jgi:tetratricopeptide (TPR) repeat protein
MPFEERVRLANRLVMSAQALAAVTARLRLDELGVQGDAGVRGQLDRVVDTLEVGSLDELARASNRKSCPSPARTRPSISSRTRNARVHGISAAAGNVEGRSPDAIDRARRRLGGRAVRLGASDDVWTQMLWRQVRAKLLARRGEHAEAHRRAREAIAIAATTDYLDFQGDAYADLAEVLLLGGKADEAAATLEQALERYERKGNLVSAQRARMRLAELQGAALR